MSPRSWQALLRRWLARRFASRTSTPPELQRALELLAAIDAGGIPLNPARINQIARSLGLEVAASAPMDETIERIRATAGRAMNSAAEDGLQ
jgi:hypothetical protein